MSSRTDSQLIGDILKAAKRVLVYVAGMSYDSFITDTKTQDAVIRNIEIIGEAVKGLSQEARDNYPEVPWRQIRKSLDTLMKRIREAIIDMCVPFFRETTN